jgi:hypothetical protein
MDGTGLRQIERLALGHTIDHVDQNDVAQLFLDRVLRDRGAHVAGANYRDLRPAGSHQCLSPSARRSLPSRVGTIRCAQS